ncbi:MAG: glycosyltransferase family 2 protein [Ignavibacteriales bacterium]|nr:glycosyltransferase family 2 protein [Ignavibacteriales bacterium]
MATLSVIVITKNEEHNIVDCLESVRWASEIVVVDGGSDDKTVDLARRFSQNVYVKPWEGYAASKNFALEQCTGDWILWLDADERVTKELSGEIQDLVAQGIAGYSGFEVSRRAFFLGKWIRHSGWYPGYVLRLFRRGSGRWSDKKVHEHLEIEGNVGRLNSDLLHYTDPNLWHYFDKFNRYTTLAAEELTSKGELFRLSQLTVRPIWLFVRMYFLKLGFLDGVQGFILCVLSSCYVFTKYAKLWELTGSKIRSKA